MVILPLNFILFQIINIFLESHCTIRLAIFVAEYTVSESPLEFAAPKIMSAQSSFSWGYRSCFNQRSMYNNYRRKVNRGHAGKGRCRYTCPQSSIPSSRVIPVSDMPSKQHTKRMVIVAMRKNNRLTVEQRLDFIA
jgi:hypothetical protein